MIKTKLIISWSSPHEYKQGANHNVTKPFKKDFCFFFLAEGAFCICKTVRKRVLLRVKQIQNRPFQPWKKIILSCYFYIFTFFFFFFLKPVHIFLMFLMLCQNHNFQKIFNFVQHIFSHIFYSFITITKHFNHFINLINLKHTLTQTFELTCFWSMTTLENFMTFYTTFKWQCQVKDRLCIANNYNYNAKSSNEQNTLHPGLFGWGQTWLECVSEGPCAWFFQLREPWAVTFVHHACH